MAVDISQFQQLVNTYKTFIERSKRSLQREKNYEDCVEALQMFSVQEIAAIFYNDRQHDLIGYLDPKLKQEIQSIWEEVDKDGSIQQSKSGELSKTTDPQEDMAALIFASDDLEEECQYLTDIVFQCDPEKVQEYMEEETKVGPLGAVLAMDYLKDSQNIDDIPGDVAIQFGFSDANECKEAIKEAKKRFGDAIQIDDDLEDIFTNTRKEIAQINDLEDDEVF